MDKIQLADELKVVLASVYTVYIKAQNYHWNVTGPNFGDYHAFFEEYYTELRVHIDLYGEHIRQLGVYTPGSLKRFSELTKISDEVAVPSPKFMFVRLAADNMILIELLKSVRSGADSLEEFGLVATLEDSIKYHSKIQWMLNSYADM